MYTSSPPEEYVADGHPMFLVAVVGMCYSPSCLTYYEGIYFYVLGGFQDVSRTVVGPLARPCIMAIDTTGEHESELAHLLYSLRKSITHLRLYIFVNQWVAFLLTECLLDGD